MIRLSRYVAWVTILIVLGGGWMSPARTGASSLAEPGISATQITIGTSLPESGPAGAYGALAGGEMAYFKYINAHGGIYGRKLSLKVYDDGYDPGRTLANVKRLVLQNNVFALLGVLGTDNNLAALPFITQQNVPLIYPATGSSKMAQPFHKYLFQLEATYTLEGKFLTDYAVHTLHAKHIAVFYQNDDFGKEGLAAATARAQQDGVSIVASASYELTDNDVSAQVLTLQRSGADAVLIFAVPTPAAGFLSTAAKVGFHAAMLSSSIAADPVLLALLGSAGDGIYFSAWLPDFNGKSAQAVAYRNVIRQYGDPVTAPIGAFTEAGVACAQVLVEGLRRAGPHPTRQALVKALETLHQWNGSLAPSLTYTSSSHVGEQGLYMAQARKGKLVPVTGYSYP